MLGLGVRIVVLVLLLQPVAVALCDIACNEARTASTADEHCSSHQSPSGDSVPASDGSRHHQECTHAEPTATLRDSAPDFSPSPLNCLLTSPPVPVRVSVHAGISEDQTDRSGLHGGAFLRQISLRI